MTMLARTSDSWRVSAPQKRCSGGGRPGSGERRSLGPRAVWRHQRAGASATEGGGGLRGFKTSSLMKTKGVETQEICIFQCLFS